MKVGCIRIAKTPFKLSNDLFSLVEARDQLTVVTLVADAVFTLSDPMDRGPSWSQGDQATR